jgi:hypothetical protein
MTTPKPYRRTMMDRLGAEGVYVLKGRIWAASLAVGFCALGFMLGPLFNLSLLKTILTAIALGTVAGLFIWASVEKGSHAASQSFKAFIRPSGDTTPYIADDSLESAMVMRGDVAGALAQFESRMAMSPSDARIRIRAAETFAGPGKNPIRARDLFREVQRIEGVAAADDIYASHRLIDLYRGPLNEPGKSLSELRRLADLYPDSLAGRKAVDALANLKKGMTFE